MEGLSAATGLQQAKTGDTSTRWHVAIANTAADVHAAQRLRYQVFAEELGADLSSSDSAGEDLDARRDCDEYDDACQHLIAIDRDADMVVGCYRILTPEAAARRAGYYSETEFDLSPLAELRTGLAEVGRACIHPDYRGGSVILMLWSALARYMQEQQIPYVMGCASVPLEDGGMSASAICQRLDAKPNMPPAYRVTPRRPYPWRQVVAGVANPAGKEPPLLKGYRRLGAWVHADAAWDPQFNTADLFVLLPMRQLNDSYARHFFGEGL
jgi:putative hemolysin